MAYYALFYEAVNDFIARRGAYRDERLRLARDAHTRGELVLAGALVDPADGALLIFQGESRPRRRRSPSKILMSRMA